MVKKINALLKGNKSKASFILMGLMVIVYIITAIMSLNFKNINPVLIERLGSDTWYYIRRGQIWRFISPAFFHFNFKHLLSNLYGMLIYATTVETLIGTGNFLILFFFSTFMGVIFSNLGYMFKVNGAGASGAIFGIVAANLILAWKIRDKMGIGYLASLAAYVAFLIYTTFNQAILGKGSVNHWAHIGGFIAGLIFIRFLYGNKREV